MKIWLEKYRLGTIPFIIFTTWLIVRIAWVGDDAYITFRSIENFIHGYGPVYNIGERVQTFTHPLWFFLQSAVNFVFNFWAGNPFGRGQMYYLNILCSILLSFAALIILSFKTASSTKHAILGLGILSVSKAFLDYSTSGLENPLTHLILAIFIWLLLEKDGDALPPRLMILTLVASLGALNRLDTFVLFLPALGWLFLKSPDKKRAFISICLGLLPLALWELFSLFYYGSLFPNTAFAKINTGIARLSLIQQGMFYYLNSLRMDPITLLVVFSGIGLGLAYGKSRHKTIALGVILYLVYILWIGGDFMGGRFFTAPLLASTIIISSMKFKPQKVYGFALGMVLLIGLSPVFLIPERRPSYGVGSSDWRLAMDKNGITDERGIYRGTLGLAHSLQYGAPKAVYTRNDWVYRPKRKIVKIVGPLGVAGYRFGPNVHIIDLNALADPLMARLPLEDPNHWRIGHFRHIIPKGYIETLESGENMIADKNIALYYDKLSLVIKGELWSWERIIEIWNLNTGKYDYLLENVTAASAQ